MKYIETDIMVLRDWITEDLPLFAKMNKDRRVIRNFQAILTDKVYNRRRYKIEILRILKDGVEESKVKEI